MEASNFQVVSDGEGKFEIRRGGRTVTRGMAGVLDISIYSQEDGVMVQHEFLGVSGDRQSLEFNFKMRTGTFRLDVMRKGNHVVNSPFTWVGRRKTKEELCTELRREITQMYQDLNLAIPPVSSIGQ